MEHFSILCGVEEVASGRFSWKVLCDKNSCFGEREVVVNDKLRSAVKTTGIFLMGMLFSVGGIVGAPYFSSSHAESIPDPNEFKQEVQMEFPIAVDATINVEM